MVKLQIILGSTRPGRNGKAVADWALETLKDRTDVSVELVDVQDFDLPLLDEPMPPMMAPGTKEHTVKWGAKVGEADAYLFVAAEYNHSMAAALKNAIDYLYAEWNNKPVGFVSYGATGGVRSVEHLRAVVGQLQMADVAEQLILSLATDFENYSTFKPTEAHAVQLNKVVDQVAVWGEALNTVRKG